MRIPTQFLVVIFSLILIVGMNVVMVSETVSENIVKQEIYNHLEGTAQSRANHVESFLELEKTTVQQLSQSIVIQKLLLTAKNDEEYAKAFNDVEKRLKSRVEIGKHTYGVFVLDKKGVIIASNDAGDIGKAKSNCPCFLGGRQGVFVKDVYTSETEGIGSLAFSAPIVDDNNEFSGVVVMEVFAEALNEITTDTAGLGETGEIYLVNRDGYMITPSRFVNDTFLKQKVDTENTRNCFADLERFGVREHEPEAISFKSYRGTDVIGVHVPIAEMEWCLLAEISEEEAFAPLAKLTKTMLSILALLSAVGMILSILISRTITKPIVKLHHGTEEIEKGNLDYKVGTDARDEIGQLSRSFDSMTANLKKSRDELEEYSKGLEKMVEERTEELKDKVKEIERQRAATLNMLEDVNETKKELERANRDMEDFTSTVSHDLKAPLRSIQGFNMLLMEDYADTLDEAGRRYLNLVNEGIERMNTLIEDLLKLSRVGRKFIDVETVDLTELLEEVKADLSARIEERGGEVEVGKLPTVSTQRVWMKELFTNLIDNGLKFNKSDKPRVEISCDASEKSYSFKVKDNGIGIEEEYLSRIFGVMERLTPQEYEGTGFGLNICKKVVDKFDGKIWVESKPGEGSTFFFTIPRN
ncbi:MAG: ATP-binding protein [Halobacteriota archaeon]